MNSIALTLTSLAAFLTAETQVPCTAEDAALFSIMIVESSGKNVKFHPDGRSYGLFGLTEVACRDIDASFPPAPSGQLATARKYLRRMVSRHCDGRTGEDSLYTACGYYHGGDRQRRNAYVRRILDLDLDAFSEEQLKAAVSRFGAMKKGER